MSLLLHFPETHSSVQLAPADLRADVREVALDRQGYCEKVGTPVSHPA